MSALSFRSVLHWLRGQPPSFFNKDGDLTADLSHAFVVAHNAGDHPTASRAALDHRADIVEIDVLYLGGVLCAGHPRNAGPFSRLFLHTLDLGVAWALASRASAVKLDLKDSSPEFVRELLIFLQTKTDITTLTVTGNPAVIETFAAEAPWVIRAFSASPEALARLQANTSLAALLDGISAAPSTFTPEAIAWAKERGLFIMTSVVNTFPEADSLLHAGVNGIITDNLALIEAIGRHADIRTLLRRG